MRTARAADQVTYNAGPVNVCYENHYGTGPTAGAAFAALITVLNASQASCNGGRPGTVVANGVSAPIFSDGVYTSTGAYIGIDWDMNGSTSIVGHCAEPCTGDPTAAVGGWLSPSMMLQAVVVCLMAMTVFLGVKAGMTR